MSSSFLLRTGLVASLVTAVFACSVTTTTTDNPGGSSSGGSSGSSGPSGGGAEAGAPTCPPNADLESDPANCGRCGRACDDGACHAGVCAPRVEVDGTSAIPGSGFMDMTVLDGHVFVVASQKQGQVQPLVMFDGETQRTLVADTGCGNIDCVITDGTTVFAETNFEVAMRYARFDGAGTKTGADIAFDNQGYGFAMLAADSGSFAVVGITGPLALVKDGQPKYVGTFDDFSLPVMVGGELLGTYGYDSVARAGASGRPIAFATLPPGGGSVGGITATSDEYLVLAGKPSLEHPTVHRYARGGPFDAPTASVTMTDAETSAINAATHAISGPLRADVHRSKPIAVDGRVYFTVDLGNDTQGGFVTIVEWSKERGFRAVGKTLNDRGDLASYPIRMVVSNGRLYWSESTITSSSTYPWRILSVPL